MPPAFVAFNWCVCVGNSVKDNVNKLGTVTANTKYSLPPFPVKRPCGKLSHKGNDFIFQPLTPTKPTTYSQIQKPQAVDY